MICKVNLISVSHDILRFYRLKLTETKLCFLEYVAQHRILMNFQKHSNVKMGKVTIHQLNVACGK